MTRVPFTKLGLKYKGEEKTIKIGEVEISIRQYLPIDDKIAFIQYVVDNALDETTGCFSPVRTEIFFSIAMCKWYAGMTFTDKQTKEITKTYDLLEENDVINLITSQINKSEINFMSELVKDTIADIARYNSSAAGIIQSMSSSADGLNTRVTEILEKIKNGEGLEHLDVIKDAVRTD